MNAFSAPPDRPSVPVEALVEAPTEAVVTPANGTAVQPANDVSGGALPGGET